MIIQRNYNWDTNPLETLVNAPNKSFNGITIEPFKIIVSVWVAEPIVIVFVKLSLGKILLTYNFEFTVTEPAGIDKLTLSLDIEL